MRQSGRVVLAGIALLVVATGAAWFCSDSIRLDYHKRQLQETGLAYARWSKGRQTSFERLIGKVGRALHLRINQESPGIKRAEHMKALLEMGYLQKVEWGLSNHIDFGLLVTNAMQRFPGEFWELGSNPSQTVVIVTAPTNQMAGWRSLIDALDVPKKQP